MTGTMTGLAIRSRLRELEGVVERGLATFVEVGRALLEIRDERLYREQHKTFEGYCRERWGMERAHAYRQIEAAGVVAALSPIGDIPRNEAQARELAPLKDDPDAMREAWQEASSNGEPTAEKVREAVAPRLGVHFSSSTPEWGTPQELFDTLHREFNFTLDVCATEQNAKVADYFDPTRDGLSQDWRGTCWMNPPYGDVIPKWVEKAWQTGRDGSVVVCLVPARVDTNWWWDYCRYGEIRILRGRLKFGGANTSAPFPSAVVVFGPNIKQRVLHWEWQ